MFERGATPAEVARQLGVSRQSASRWRREWHKGGNNALKSTGRRGRTNRVTEAQLKKVEKALLKGARAYGFENDLWTLERVGEVIYDLTGVAYHPGHVWKVLKRLGWSRQRPARHAAERADKAIEAWVKKRWPRVKKTPGPGARG